MQNYLGSARATIRFMLLTMCLLTKVLLGFYQQAASALYTIKLGS